jgi:hypothetical protein
MICMVFIVTCKNEDKEQFNFYRRIYGCIECTYANYGN